MLSFLLAGILLAQTQVAAAPTPVPNPKPDLAPMMYFSGTWTCHQKLRGKDRPDTSTGSMVLNNRWLRIHDVAPPFDQYRKLAVNGDTYVTYDPQIKQFVSVEVDDFGGYFVAYSPGWSGNTLVWTSNGPAKASAIQTITRTSDSAYSWVGKGTDFKGKVQPVQSGTCTKS